jgi:hypothetical protein
MWTHFEARPGGKRHGASFPSPTRESISRHACATAVVWIAQIDSSRLATLAFSKTLLLGERVTGKTQSD